MTTDGCRGIVMLYTGLNVWTPNSHQIILSFLVSRLSKIASICRSRSCCIVEIKFSHVSVDSVIWSWTFSQFHGIALGDSWGRVSDEKMTQKGKMLRSKMPTNGIPTVHFILRFASACLFHIRARAPVWFPHYCTDLCTNCRGWSWTLCPSWTRPSSKGNYAGRKFRW